MLEGTSIAQKLNVLCRAANEIEFMLEKYAIFSQNSKTCTCVGTAADLFDSGLG